MVGYSPYDEEVYALISDTRVLGTYDSLKDAKEGATKLVNSGREVDVSIVKLVGEVSEAYESVTDGLVF